jgi:Family of unknown function (DUF6169)
MQKEEHPLSNTKGYDFVYLGGKNNSFYFETSSKIIYEVKFKPTDYFFRSNSTFASETYEFVIEVEYNPTEKLPLGDPLIPPTVATILYDFFRQKERIVIYTCETKDRKHHARFRKFEQWFRAFNDDTFLKIDCPINDPKANLVYYNSLIIKQNNPFKNDIIVAFRQAIHGLNDGK